MSNLKDVEADALRIAESHKWLDRLAKFTAVAAMAVFVGGLVFFASDADLFARWGAVGIGIALIWSAYWSRKISSLQHEYAFDLRSSGPEFVMMMTGDDGALARDTVNRLDLSIPKLATFILMVEIIMSFVSTADWGYGDKILCKLAKWEVASC